MTSIDGNVVEVHDVDESEVTKQMSSQISALDATFESGEVKLKTRVTPSCVDLDMFLVSSRCRSRSVRGVWIETRWIVV